MNLEKEILKEHSKTQRDRIVNYVGKDAKRLSELVALFLKGPYRVTQRASWPLSHIAEFHPELFASHLTKIINNLKTPGLHPAVKRNTVRLLQFVEIPKRLEGTVAEVCFSFLHDKKETIAVHVFAMTVLAMIARKQPELKNELKIMIEDQLPYAGPAIHSRATKILRELNS
ncbi:MAG TPA: hypothetical protein VFE57_04025 [Cyclobacteriaceae bacterium]|jgi:hypothetical protein|nr:hypothetical protein [Cyclobacteriaceae bacterium]